MWILKRLRQRANKFELNRSDEHPSSVFYTFFNVCGAAGIHVLSFLTATLTSRFHHRSTETASTDSCEPPLRVSCVYINKAFAVMPFVESIVWIWGLFPFYCSQGKFGTEHIVLNINTLILSMLPLFLYFNIYIILYLCDLIVNVFILYLDILLIKQQ